MKKCVPLSLVLLTACAAARAERVVDLPEYDGRFYLTVIYDDSEQSGKLHDFVRTARFTQFRDQCVYNEYTDQTALIKSTAWKTFLGPNRPAVLLQAAQDRNGKAKIVFYASGENLPIGNDLYVYLQNNLNSYVAAHNEGKAEQWVRQCPNGRCWPRQPQPTPEPPTPPVVIPPVEPITPTVPVVPEIPQLEAPEEVADDDGIPVIPLLLLIFGASAFGIYTATRKGK